MKKIIAIILTLVMVLVFTGCMHGEDAIQVNKDGSGMIKGRLEYEKAVVDQTLSEMEMTLEDAGMADLTVETVDGVEYYVMEEVNEFSCLEELKEFLEYAGYEDVYVTETGIRFLYYSGYSEEDAEAMKAEGYDIAEGITSRILITMPDKIVKTTGTLSEDQMTAEFYFKDGEIYEAHDIMVSTAKETKKPTISGATNKKTYNSARTITGKDASGIQKIQYKYKKSSKASYGKYYTIKGSKTFTKNGTYYVRAYDYYGNKTVKTFTIKDTSKPKVEGVTNKKTYSSERYLEFTDNCAVKTVKLYKNGKRVELTSDEVEYGTYVDASGSYKVIVTDVNGNSRTVTFKIK